MRSLVGRGFFLFFGKHLNDACKLSEFAMQGFQTICMFSRCFQIFFFYSVKYFNKPKPCGIFFRCLNCAPHPALLVILSFFQFFVHLIPVCGFCQITLLEVMFYPPQIVFSFTALIFQKILLLQELAKIILDVKEKLVHRITILIHKFHISTISVWPNILTKDLFCYFQAFVNPSQFSQRVLCH